MEQQLSALQELIDTLVQFFVNYSFQVFGAVIILIVGFFLAKILNSLILKLCEKRHVDIALAHFLALCGKTTVLAFAVIIALGKFGVTIAPFVAALGAIAFGSTMAIQGPLSNYGAGLSIILSRNFKVGDTITVIGVSGVVEDVTLACTKLITEDGVKVTIPNKHIVGEVLHNSAKHRVVESKVGIGYAEDPEKAIRMIHGILAGISDIAADPAPQIGIESFGDSSVNISYRYWALTTKYIQTSFAVNLAVLKALKEAHITIPFPQRELKIISQVNNTKF